jgi:hypothetical protein
MGGFAELSGDGVAELIVLQDRMSNEPAQTLAVYRLDNKGFRVVAHQALPLDRIAYALEGVRESSRGKEILVRTASPAACQAGGILQPKATMGTASYTLRGDRLQPNPVSGH